MNKFKKLLLLVIIALISVNMLKTPLGRANKDKSFAKVSEKLYKKENNFDLKKDFNFIQTANAAENDINPSSYVVINYDTGRVISEKNMDQKVSIASVTKIMSAIIALDLADPNKLMTISDQASNVVPTKIGVVPGQKMTVKELMEAMLLTSANDAAEGLKDGVDKEYGEGTFVRAMNEKAKFLGLYNTSFSNPQGFDSPTHYSTAHDLAVLSHYGLENYPLIKAIVAKDYLFLAENQNHKQFDLYNWNGLLDVYPGADGIKIGNTGNAGYTTIVTSERNGTKLLVVVLGAPGILQRDMWAANLLDTAFEQSAGLAKVNITQDQLRAKYSTWKYFN